jgi:serine protein kinase
MNKTFNSYMNEVAAYVSKSKIKDPYTGKESYPDERLMFSIEEKMGMGDPHVDDWRRLIMAQVGSYVVRGREWRIDSNPKLHKAIEADTWDKLTKSANKILNNKKP